MSGPITLDGASARKKALLTTIAVLVVFALGSADTQSSGGFYMYTLLSFTTYLCMLDPPRRKRDYFVATVLTALLPLLRGYLAAIGRALDQTYGTVPNLFIDRRDIWGSVLGGLPQNEAFIRALRTDLMATCILLGGRTG